MLKNKLFSGKIYTAGTNSTRMLVATVATNPISVPSLIYPKNCSQGGKLTVMVRAKNGSLTKIGVVWQKSDFWTKNRNFGPKKRGPLFYSNHVLATTGKSCSKKKSAFAQIIKGGNVILGDFLG